MTIIEVTPLSNGAHNNQTIYGVDPRKFPIPSGWALVPDEMLPLENFPFGDVEADEIDGILTLTKWTPGEIPEPEPEPEPEPSEQDWIEAQVLWTAVQTNTLLEE